MVTLNPMRIFYVKHHDTIKTTNVPSPTLIQISEIHFRFSSSDFQRMFSSLTLVLGGRGEAKSKTKPNLSARSTSHPAADSKESLLHFMPEIQK